MTAKVIKDTGWSRKILELLERKDVTVGVHSKDAGREGGPNNAQIGTWHEFGIGNPPRSFLRSTFDENLRNYQLFLSRSWGQALSRGSGDFATSLARVGLKIKNDVVNKINAGIKPGNEESTIARKGSSTPLVDTGQLKAAINFEVEA
jgi:hypothetical protein